MIGGHPCFAPVTMTRTALLALTVFVAVLLMPTVALAHVPFLEPPGASDTRGPASAPFPDAVRIGGPEVSRAIYGYLGPRQGADVYTFTVATTLTAPVGILVPVETGNAGFRPELTLYGGDRPVGLFDRTPGVRATLFEPFSAETLYRGPEQDVTFAPGREYQLAVTPGTGTLRTGRYVVSMGTAETFSLQDAASVLPQIVRIKLGLYSEAPLRWDQAAWMAGCALLLVVVVALAAVVAGRRRGRRKTLGRSDDPAGVPPAA